MISEERKKVISKHVQEFLNYFDDDITNEIKEPMEKVDELLAKKQPLGLFDFIRLRSINRKFKKMFKKVDKEVERRNKELLKELEGIPE